MLNIDNEKSIETVVENEMKRILRYYYKMLGNVIMKNLIGSVNYFRAKTQIMPEVDIKVTTSPFLGSDEYVIVIKVRIPEHEQTKIREVLKKKLLEHVDIASIRIKALYNIIRNELEAATGELDALLPDMHPGSPEGTDKAGGGGKEIQYKEGGHTSEGSLQGSGGGDEVEGGEE